MYNHCSQLDYTLTQQFATICNYTVFVGHMPKQWLWNDSTSSNLSQRLAMSFLSRLFTKTSQKLTTNGSVPSAAMKRHLVKFITLTTAASAASAVGPSSGGLTREPRKHLTNAKKVICFCINRTKGTKFIKIDPFLDGILKNNLLSHFMPGHRNTIGQVSLGNASFIL